MTTRAESAWFCNQSVAAMIIARGAWLRPAERIVQSRGENEGGAIAYQPRTSQGGRIPTFRGISQACSKAGADRAQQPSGNRAGCE